MTLRTQRRLLLFLSLTLLACAGTIAVWPWTPWGKLDPLPVVQLNLQTGKSAPSKSQHSPEVQLTALNFQKSWESPLRRPLFDPPPPPPPKLVEKPPPRPIAAQLLATMIEPKKSMAMIRLSTGEVVFRKLGDELGAADQGAKITAIEAGTIKVVRDQQETSLRVPGQGGK